MKESFRYLNDEDFEQQISAGLTLVDFYADWCGPCRMMEPVIAELANEMEGKAVVAKIDIESSQKTALTYNVTSIPTIILFKDGQECKRVVGIKDKKYLKEMMAAFI